MQHAEACSTWNPPDGRRTSETKSALGISNRDCGPLSQGKHEQIYSGKWWGAASNDASSEAVKVLFIVCYKGRFDAIRGIRYFL